MNTNMNQGHLKIIFHCFCVLATISLQINCLYNYWLNETASIVEYQNFQEDDISGYPSLSFCIFNPYLENKLRIKGTNSSSYLSYLQGMSLDKRNEAIKYEDVTISLDDVLSTDPKDSYFLFANEKIQRMTLSGSNTYVSLETDVMKCFTIDVPFKKDELIEGYSVSIKNSIFPNNRRPMATSKQWLEGFILSFHYPRQSLLASNPWEGIWKDRSNKTSEYIMQYKIKSLTVVERRKSNSRRQCVENWKTYDTILMESLIKKIGCHPRYWKTDFNIDACSNWLSSNLSSNAILHTMRSSQILPCKYIEQVIYSYKEIEGRGRLSGNI